MSRESENPLHRTVGEWLQHAESDVRLARLGQGHEGILSGQICFHAQQAAEKALKAVLLAKRISFPLTHDIEALLEIADQGDLAIPIELQDAGWLTPYAVETRYPGDWQEITESEVNEALELAEKTLEWAKEAVREEPSSNNMTEDEIPEEEDS